MQFRKIIILFLLSILMSGCNYSTVNQPFKEKQVKVSEFLIPHSPDFNYTLISVADNNLFIQDCRIFPKGKMGTTLYSTSDLTEYKKIVSFPNHAGHYYINPNHFNEMFFVSGVNPEGLENLIFRSNDAGRSWQQVYSNTAKNLIIATETLVYDPFAKNKLFLIINSREQGINIIQSIDSGAHWRNIATTQDIIMAYQIVIDPHDSNHFIVPSANGLWESWDGGFSWKNIIESETTSAVFSSAEKNKVYFTTRESIEERCIYELDNGRISNIRLPDQQTVLADYGVYCREDIKKVFVVTTWYYEKDAVYKTVIYQYRDDSWQPLAQFTGQGTILKKMWFDDMHPDNLYIQSHQKIYKIFS
ncbi:MAG: hypothetical protein GXY49_12695 [Syntrophomonadaceae bacterium]|nr:hypothetical protein [Syntrophomonadaceae bacterium]